MKNQLYKKLILPIVALVLVSTMVIGITYSWIENITAVEISNGGSTGDNENKQSVAYDIAETINIDNCGEKGSVIGTTGTTANNWADLGAYFNEPGGMHLTTCSGNGDSFMFRSLKGGDTTNLWRIGTEDDENVNYISATFRINVSDKADVDFWFKQIPTVKEGTTKLDIAYYSFTVDGETKVYTTNPPTGGKYDHINNAEGTTKEAVPVESTAKYTFGDPSNYNPADKNDINTNVLFSIPKNTTKDVTVRIWLQDTDNRNTTITGKKVTVDMQIVSTWAVTRRIRIFDGTSDKDTEHWIYNENAKMYLALSSNPTKFYWPLNIDKDTHYGYADIPSYYYKGAEICIYRCNGDFNSGTIGENGIIDYNNIKCWNYWATTLPEGFKNETFNILGNTPVDDNKQSDIGYIYWGEVEHITVTDDIRLNHTPEEKVRMIVYDADTNFYYSLYPNSSNKCFSGYIPKSSDKIQFRYKEGNGFEKNKINSINYDQNTNKQNCYMIETDYKYHWGYDSTATEPQKRPLGATNYKITGEHKGEWTDIKESGYSLTGDFSGTALYIDSENSNKAYANVDLTNNKLYQFKLTDKNGVVYSNDGVMCYSQSNNYPMTTKKNSTNLLLISLGAGTYKFELDFTDTNNIKLSVTYPEPGTNSKKYLYLVVKSGFEGTDKYANYYYNSSNEKSDYRLMTWMNNYKDYNGWNIYIADYTDRPDKVQFTTEIPNVKSKMFDCTGDCQRYYIG